MTRGGRERLPEGLGAEVERALGRLGGTPGPGTAGGIGSLVERWPGAVGASVAANAWPARYQRDGTLLVHVRTSVWAQELTQLEEMLRASLGPDAPPRLRFVVGPLPDPEHVPDTSRRAPEPSGEDLAEAERLAGEVGSDELREGIRKAVALSLAAARTVRPDRPV